MTFSGSGSLFAGVAVLVAALAMQAPPARAQDASAGLEEIVVTARKREEALQSAPVSVTALSGESLEQRHVATIAEVGAFVPNVSFESGANISGATSAVTMFIRGVGQTDFNLTIDPGVGLYVDGVYVSRAVGALLDTVDVGSVQVLRGPQGILFGKNTIGGAVVVESRKPSPEPEAWIEGTVGTDDRIDVRAAANGELLDNLSVRAVVSSQNRDGYVTRLTDGEEMGDKDSVAGRISALWEPRDDLSFLFALDATRTREAAAPQHLAAINENGQFAFFWNKILNGAVCGPPGTPTPDLPQCYTAQWRTADKDRTWANDPNESSLDLWGAMLTATWDISDSLRVKSITSYRDLESGFHADGDVSPLPISRTTNDYRQEQWSQELQLLGTSFDSRLQWIVGGYYLYEEGTDRNMLTFSIADFQSGGHVENDSMAVFAQGQYSITDALRISVGGRVTHEKKRFLPDQFIITDRTGGGLLFLSQLFIPPELNPDGRRILPFEEKKTTVTEFTPSVTVDYQFSDALFGYFTFSQGFKSGGFTQRVFPPEPEVPDFDPEFVDSYEVGFKSEFLDRRLRLNSAVFYTDYSDLQIIVNEGIAPKVRNAGEATLWGVELEVEAAPTERLTLSGGFGYIDAEYDEVAPTAAPVTEDSELPHVPEWTATAGLRLDLWEGSLGQTWIRADWSYKGAHFKNAVNSPDLYQDAFSLLGASINWESPNGAWSASLGGTNLFDERYLISGHEDLANLSSVYTTFSRGREWFLRLRYEF